MSDEVQAVSDEIDVWLEEHTAIMIRAVTREGDPVELQSTDARRLAGVLISLADRLDREP